MSSSNNRIGRRTAIISAPAALTLLALAAAVYFLRGERPDLFRAKTEMEKRYPVCVLGISEPTGVVSPEKAGLRNIFINFKTSFPAEAVKAIRASGAVPMITWEPYFEDIRREALLPDIAAGKHDAYIKRFAGRARGGPLFIRFAHEPNSDWYGWSGTISPPGQYVEAFRRVRKTFLAQGNKDAKFIFSVNAEDVPDADWNRFESYYPGDEYADIIGLDAYNWGSGKEAWEKWRSPQEALTAAYERSVRAFPSKPIFITETASCPEGGDKVGWLERLLASVGQRFPAVKAVVWFDFNKDCDWRLSTPEMRAGFYGACGKGRLTCSAESLDWIFKETP